jgi:hypothetical protein
MTLPKQEKKKLRIQLNDMLDRHCSGCTIKTEKFKELGIHGSQQYCLKECSIGVEIGQIGKKLTGTKKGVVEMEVIKEVRDQEKVLTKDKYLKHKEKGLKDSQIFKLYGKHSLWLTQLKREWGLIGIPKVNSKPSVPVAQEPKAEPKTEDIVNHPPHYKSGGIETIDYMKAKLSKEQFEGYLAGNVMKYISRYPHKNGVEDLKKAQWYLNKLIESEGENT